MGAPAKSRNNRPWARWSNWRSVRIWESDTRQHLRKKHSMWLHGWCIGALVMVAMWASAYLQMLVGVDSLALRYGLTLGVGYAAYLAVIRVWAGMLVGESAPLDGVDAGDALDAGELAVEAAGQVAGQLGRVAGSVVRSGGGGDFGGGGAALDFAAAGDGGSGLASGAADAIADAGGDVVGGVFEAAGSADEGIVVVVPVLIVFLIACAVILGAGSLMLLYFGADVLMAVAVEIAFSYVTARTAVKVARQGWLWAAVRLTWKPLLGALFAAVLLGALLDHFVPQANSLPEAFRMLRHKG